MGQDEATLVAGLKESINHDTKVRLEYRDKQLGSSFVYRAGYVQLGYVGYKCLFVLFV